MIGLVNYDAGNLRSVETALNYLGISFRTISHPHELADSGKLIVPGVGEARSAMDSLKSNGMDRALLDFISRDRPFLGICLGAQILLDGSEERDASCLGVIPGQCRGFRKTYEDRKVPIADFKIPHIGWNQVHYKEGQRAAELLFAGIPQGASFYFDHGFYLEPASGDLVLAVSDHGIQYPASIGKDKVLAVQFHPEKSGPYGLRLLENFAKHIN